MYVSGGWGGWGWGGGGGKDVSVIFQCCLYFMNMFAVVNKHYAKQKQKFRCGGVYFVCHMLNATVELFPRDWFPSLCVTSCEN